MTILPPRTGKKQRVKTARFRKTSSTLWLQRQLNDPYVQAAKQDGYRSRAAYKLLQLNDKYRFFAEGQTVIDLGAAPGGWTQVALQKVGDTGSVIGLDILPMEAIPPAVILEMDFTKDEAVPLLKQHTPRGVDVVLSDMAMPTIGHAKTDHLRTLYLCELAVDFALSILKPKGSFVCKAFQGGAGQELVGLLKRNFTSVKHAKPEASRAEIYFVAQGFKG
jgi:23S rRNA (uridine2552-2'-O)-methyltransferase